MELRIPVGYSSLAELLCECELSVDSQEEPDEFGEAMGIMGSINSIDDFPGERYILSVEG